MAPKRKATTSQRKLHFDAHRKDDTNDVIVIDDSDDGIRNVSDKSPKPEATRGRKRSASIPSTTPDKRHQSIQSFMSPKKERRISAPIVTPAADEAIQRPTSQTTSDYVPTYIHKNVEYRPRRDQSAVSPRTAKVMQWILNEYEIPQDIEQDRSFGPLSGSSYEDRIIAAYSVGKLQRRTSSAVRNDSGAKESTVMICTSCAELGHVRDKCPQLV